MIHRHEKTLGKKRQSYTNQKGAYVTYDYHAKALRHCNKTRPETSRKQSFHIAYIEKYFGHHEKKEHFTCHENKDLTKNWGLFSHYLHDLRPSFEKKIGVSFHKAYTTYGRTFHTAYMTYGQALRKKLGSLFTLPTRPTAEL